MILKFLKTPLGNIVALLLVAILLWNGAKIWLYNHDQRIRSEITSQLADEQNKIIMENIIKFQEAMVTVLETQNETLRILDQERSNIDADADAKINSIANMEDRPSSDVLKETIRMLTQ